MKRHKVANEYSLNSIHTNFRLKFLSTDLPLFEYRFCPWLNLVIHASNHKFRHRKLSVSLCLSWFFVEQLFMSKKNCSLSRKIKDNYNLILIAIINSPAQILLHREYRFELQKYRYQIPEYSLRKLSVGVSAISWPWSGRPIQFLTNGALKTELVVRRYIYMGSNITSHTSSY